MNILYLEKRGMDFRADDERVKDSDIGNYRVCTGGYDILGKNGKRYCIEVMRGDKYVWRKTHKRTGKPLKHAKHELVTENAAYLDACWKDADGFCYKDLAVWRGVSDGSHPYTERGILDMVNSFAAVPYDAVRYV